MPEELRTAIEKVNKAAHAKGKKSGMFCTSGAQAREFADQGFDMVYCPLPIMTEANCLDRSASRRTLQLCRTMSRTNSMLLKGVLRIPHFRWQRVLRKRFRDRMVDEDTWEYRIRLASTLYDDQMMNHFTLRTVCCRAAAQLLPKAVLDRTLFPIRLFP